MPSYVFKCRAGHRHEKVLPAADAGKKQKCRQCNRVAERDYVAEHGGYRHKPGNWPMASEAMAVHPDQISEAVEEARKIGVPTEFTREGSPVFTGPDHRRKYCEAHGVRDNNGGYSDPQGRDR